MGISRLRLPLGEGGVDRKGTMAMNGGRTGLFRDIEMTMGRASGAEAERLDIDQSVQVFRIRRVRLFQGRPFMLEQSYLPASLFPDLEKRADPPYQLCAISAAYGIVPARAQERAAEIAADRIVAERLEIAEGSSILFLDRVVCSSEGKPIEWRLAQCRLRGGHYRADVRRAT